MPAITFEMIWKNYPSTDPCVNPKTSAVPSGYENQCAIRVGYALERSGLSFHSFKGGRCPYAGKRSGLVASAQELANWLGPTRFEGCPSPERYKGTEAFEKMSGRTGIVFIADYWRRTTDKKGVRSGDHIDLWNGSRMTSTSSWFRVHWGISWDGLWSDFRLSPRVLFWHIQ